MEKTTTSFGNINLTYNEQKQKQSQYFIRKTNNQRYSKSSQGFRVNKINPMMSNSKLQEILEHPSTKGGSRTSKNLSVDRPQIQPKNESLQTQPSQSQQEQQNQQQIEKECQKQHEKTRQQEEQRFKKMDVTQFFNQHQEYQKHLAGDCICGRCICGKCKCGSVNYKPEHQQTKQTIYKNDFRKNKKSADIPVMTMDFYSSFYSRTPNQKFNYNSTNRIDFKPTEQTVQFYRKINKRKEDQPFNGTSSYANNYIDWKYNANDNLMPKPESTVIPNLNFVDKTMYKDNFLGKQPKVDQDLQFAIAWAKRPNLRFPDFPLLSETTNEQTYKPFLTKILDNNRKENKFEISPAYKGQFKSTAQKEFGNIGKINCPSRLELHEQHLQQIQENNSKFTV